MAAPQSFWGQTIADNTKKSNGTPETSSFEVPIITLTAANLTATNTLIDNLRNAILFYYLGNVTKDTVTLNRDNVGDVAAGNVLAQRENKLMLRYIGNVSNKIFRVSIPTLDLTTLVNHTEYIDLTTTEGAALKTAFEAVVRSPDDASETVTLLSGQFVGRNT